MSDVFLCNHHAANDSTATVDAFNEFRHRRNHQGILVGTNSPGIWEDHAHIAAEIAEIAEKTRVFAVGTARALVWVAEGRSHRKTLSN